MTRSTFTPLGQAAAWLALVIPFSATAQSFSPTGAALGFNVFTTGNFTVVGGDTHGPVAVGGNMVLAGSAPLVMNTTGTYPTNTPNSAANYGLVINGVVSYVSGNNPTYVNHGLVRIANTTGTTLYDKDNNNSNTDLQLTSGAFNSIPRVQKQNGLQDKTTTTLAHGINFGTATTQIAQASSTINGYVATNCQSKLNYIPMPSCNSCNPALALVANKVNFVNITTQSQLAALLSVGSLNVSPAPTATSPLIFNVTLGGTISWPVPNMGGVGGQDGPYILWNFPNATAINFSGGQYNNSVYGTILAPQAAITKDGGNNFEGQVLSSSLSLNTGEIHYQPFAALLPVCGTALALEDLSLAAAREGSAVRLTWRALTPDSYALTLERSTDGHFWTRIAGNLAGASYQDAGAPAGPLQYRLRAGAAGGDVRFSNIVRVAGGMGATTVTASPNPFTDALTIAGVDDARKAVLLDATGRTVAQSVFADGVVRLEGLFALLAGLYLLRVEDAQGGITMQKMVKQ